MNLDQNRLLYQKITAGCAKVTGKTILHTAPHHDDILLSYHAYAIKLLSDNDNHVTYITSGSNGVSDAFVVRMLTKVSRQLVEQVIQGSYAQCIQEFVQAHINKDDQQLDLYKNLIFIHLIAEIFNSIDANELMSNIDFLQSFFELKKIGNKDIPVVVQLKGRIRESESETKWMISQGHYKNITHLRSSFYYADSRRVDAAMEYDIKQFVQHLEQVQPDIITVALDPSGVGPRNHYRSLQLITAALNRCPQFKDIQVVGYRNVWSSFDLDETSMIVPVTESEVTAMESVFNNCYATQKNTIFAGTEVDGNFTAQVRYIQQVQWQQVQEKLGSDFTLNNQLDTASKFAGAIFFQKMSVDTLISRVRNDQQEFLI